MDADSGSRAQGLWFRVLRATPVNKSKEVPKVLDVNAISGVSRLLQTSQRV
jgi:hypothetical protein